MHEEIGVVRGLDDSGDGAVSPVSTSFRPGRGSPSTSAGVTVRPESSVTSSPACSAPARRAVRDAERVGGRDVEPAGPLGLDERVAERLGAVLDRESLDRVVVALERLPGLELDERERVREPPEERAAAA